MFGVKKNQKSIEYPSLYIVTKGSLTCYALDQTGQ